jgi:serine/threonine protein kinase
MSANGISVEKYCPSCGLNFPQGQETIRCAGDNTVLLPVTKDELLGKIIDHKVEILTVLGAGASSTVYRARQVDLGRPVAFKLLRTDLVSSALKIQRFGQEARLIGRLDHPNVCRVYDFGILNSGQPYLVLEIIEGKSLATVLKDEGTLLVSRAVYLCKEIAEGLKEAHRKGIIHRDLKPSNIMVVETGAGETIKLIDFGLAKAFAPEREDPGASSGYVVGTPSYMSPEQVLGHPLDARTDIYSLGCIFSEMLTGKKAIDGVNAFEIMSRHLRTEPQLNRDEGGISPQLKALVLKCMRKDPDSRYQTAQEVLDALSAVETGSASLVQPVHPLHKFLRSMPGYVTAGLVCLTVLGLSLHSMNQNYVRETDHAAQLISQLKDCEARNEIDQAERLGKEAFQWLKIHGKEYSPEMIDLGRAMQRIYAREVRTQESGEYIKAVFEAQRVLAARDTSGGTDKLLAACREAGTAYLNCNSDEQAMPYLEQWLALIEKKSGNFSKDCTQPLLSLCRAEVALGNYKAADRNYRRLVELCEKHHAGHDIRLSVMNEAAELYLKMGDPEAASTLADQAVSLLAGASQPIQSKTLQRSALCAASCGQYVKASRLIDRATELNARSGASQDELQLLVLKGRYLREAKRYRQAETVSRQAVVRVTTYDTDGNLYKWAINEYAKVLEETGRKAEAETVRLTGKLSSGKKIKQ